ncbi:Bud site selection protein 6, partial [Ascosphaera atra]
MSKQNDAIGLLQRSGELERRASRRFSAYQIQKHLGTPPSGVPVLPSPQHPPVANRGREVRESMNAVRLRGSYLSRQRPPADPNKRSFDRGRGEEEQHVAPRIRGSGDSIPTTQPSGERLRRTPEGDPLMGSQRKAPPLVHQPEPGEPPAEVPPQPNGVKEPLAPVHTQQSSDEQPPPPPSKELTLFLQYRSKIKKYVLPDGAADLTIGRLQLAFIEKFAWNTHSNGADLPEIYIQDPVSGIRHELEDLTDVKDRSVLVLNVEPLDEVKKHFDEQVSGVRTLLESVKSLVENQGSSLQHLNDHQQEAAKEIARFAVQSPPVQDAARRSLSSADARLHARSPSNAAKLDGLDEVRTLRRDLAVLRQTYTTFSSDITASMKTIRKKAESVKGVAADVSTPSYEGDAGRAHINAGKKTLADESEKLVARVDDLQDLVEDLRKDVVTRGVRPLPRQLEAVGRDIGAVTKELKKMQEFLKKEKPVWTKIWEKELQMVCEERDQLTMQEDLAIDLEDDLEKASQTFALVEQATRQQNNQSNTNNAVGARTVSRGFPVDPVADLSKAKDSVLGEVKALQPNHQNRLDAIERAEKARQRELESRRVGKFQKELGNFVQEGKLKKSGGVEEAERMREAKDEQARRDVWEQERARKQSLEAGEEKPAGDEASGAQEQPGEEGSAPAEEK